MNRANSDITADALLLLQIEEGNSDAFDILYNRYWKLGYNAAYKRLKNIDQAKDIVHDVFINIWHKKETHIDNFPAYLNIAIRNRVFKLVDKQKKTSSFFDLLQDIPATSTADSNICWKEFNKAYEALLKTLPQKRQVIFHLRFNEDLTTKAISEQLGISRKTVQNQLGKATEQLRTSLMRLLILLIITLPGY